MDSPGSLSSLSISYLLSHLDHKTYALLRTPLRKQNKNRERGRKTQKRSMVDLTSRPTKIPPSSTTGDQGAADGAISSVHPDILITHVLTRLDGPTLAAAACASPYLRALSADESLWREICTSVWPSINDSRVRRVISIFSSGHRSFFSDSFPLLYHDCNRVDDHHHPITDTTELISAVDVYYQGVPIFSKVVETQTVGGWFLSSPFGVELLEPKESVQTWVQQDSDDKDIWPKQLGENLTLSWILIDPKMKRAMNLSSQKPVSVERHWLTGEVEARFATIMAGDGKKGSRMEYTQCEIVMACVGKLGGKVHMQEVSVGMEDMEGRKLSGKDSLVILQAAMERGERRKGKGGKEGEKRFEKFVERKRVWKERKQSKERALDLFCQCAAITLFLAFLFFILLR
uniref:F-box domain-containing protein n=1 Tax=Rhizophora mucronata TaxID=61149 RepID=A0A2P2NYT4_RHIMU